MYGCGLSKLVRERSMGLFELKEGRLYLALKRLEKERLYRGGCFGGYFFLK